MPTNVSTEKLMMLQVVRPPRGMSLAPRPGMKKHGPLSSPPPPPEVRIMARADDMGGGGATVWYCELWFRD